jgi:signal transduction histidine kinase
VTVDQIAIYLRARTFLEITPLHQDLILEMLHDVRPPAARDIWKRMPVHRFWMLLVRIASKPSTLILCPGMRSLTRSFACQERYWSGYPLGARAIDPTAAAVTCATLVLVALPKHRKEVRASILLAASLAALLLVIGLSTTAIWWDATVSQDRVAALQQSHMQTDVALAAIRANVYLNAVPTRDYFLDPDPVHNDRYAEQFRQVHASVEESFQTLLRSGLDNDQKGAVETLRTELAAFWDPTKVMLDWTSADKRAQRAEMLRQRVHRREEIFAVTAQIERLVSANFTRERERIMTADRDLRTSVGWTIGISLMLGFAISGGAVFRMLTLERHSRLTESALRLLSAQIRTTQEQERKYLSRELHDQVGQMLTGLRMELTSIARDNPDQSSQTCVRIASARNTVELTLRMIRNIAMLLRPSMLDDLGLAPAIAWLLKDMSQSSGIETQVDIEASVDKLPDTHRTCVYRLVQECVTNASRHSGARHFSVTLRKCGEWLVGVIADDGRGFDIASKQADGLGLLGMRERVREIGGSLQIESSPGSGTRIEFRLSCPVERESDNDTDLDSGRSRHRSNGVAASA